MLSKEESKFKVTCVNDPTKSAGSASLGSTASRVFASLYKQLCFQMHRGLARGAALHVSTASVCSGEMPHGGAKVSLGHRW